MTTSALRKLAHIILDSVDEIENTLSERPGGLPSLDVPITDSTELDLYRQIHGPATKIKAACGQLTASVSIPTTTLEDAYWGHFLSSCVKVVGVINVAEILREAGPQVHITITGLFPATLNHSLQGLHVRKICEPSGTDPEKITRLLRLMASHHIFREVEPNVFANNRLSSLLDSGTSVEDLFHRPDRKRSDKFMGPWGAFSAHVEFMVDDMFTASTKITECLTGEQTAKSTEPTDAPVNIAFNTQLPVMKWQQLPENELRKTRFDVAMSINARREGPLQGFDWKKMTPGSLLVDVGGGFGTLFLNMVQEYKHLRYVVEDQDTVISEAKSYWKNTNPEALESGRIGFKEIDFFKSQPIKDASLFILRHIVHDWSDPYAVRILSHLREAAQPSTKLVIIDIEVPLVCKDTSPESLDQVIRRGQPEWMSSPPEPLLPNCGMGRLRPYFLDLLMLTFNNGKERTMQGFYKLISDAGWKIDEVYFIRETVNLQIVAVPN